MPSGDGIISSGIIDSQVQVAICICEIFINIEIMFRNAPVGCFC